MPFTLKDDRWSLHSSRLLEDSTIFFLYGEGIVGLKKDHSFTEKIKVQSFSWRMYIGQRFLQLIPMLVVMTIVVFGLMHLTQDDVVDAVFGKQEALSATVQATMRAELGLDSSWWTQYWFWLSHILQGDLGRSYVTGRSVGSLLGEKLSATVLLMAASLLVTWVLAVPAGMLAAWYRNSRLDYMMRFLSFWGTAVPGFLVALLLLYIFAVKGQWLPVIATGRQVSDLILPTASLSLAMSAKYFRQTRSLTALELAKPYVEALRTRGIKPWRILLYSVWPNISAPLVTLTALSCGSLLGGTVIVESIFRWDGVGRLAFEAILNRDYPILQAYILWLSVVYMLINLGADLWQMYRARKVGQV